MLTIICGEDSAASRDYFYALKKELQKKDYDTFEIPSLNIGTITSWMLDSQSLFARNKAFFTQNLNKTISRKANLKQTKIIEEIIKDKNVELYDWEDEVPARFLKITADVKVKEFKLSETIFKLVDACYPGNLKEFVKLLANVTDKSDEIFTFIMLTRHMRNIMLLRLGQTPPKILPWQVSRLKGQASRWEAGRIVSFYDALHNIDQSLKTSTLPYSLSHALDILASYSL